MFVHQAFNVTGHSGCSLINDRDCWSVVPVGYLLPHDQAGRNIQKSGHAHLNDQC